MSVDLKALGKKIREASICNMRMAQGENTDEARQTEEAALPSREARIESSREGKAMAAQATGSPFLKGAFSYRRVKTDIASSVAC